MGEIEGWSIPMEGGRTSPHALFEVRGGKGGAAAYRVFVGSVAVAVFSVWAYRIAGMPARGDAARPAWTALFAAELWFGLQWLVSQLYRCDPLFYSTFRDRLARRFEKTRLPDVDIFICTADPIIEPPILVANTVLSLMAIDYPKEKLWVYLSDDGGSKLTFYTMVEVANYARHWIPFCEKFKVEPRSPSAYLSCISDASSKDVIIIKTLYEEMERRINDAVTSGRVPEDVEFQHKGYSEWDTDTKPSDHQSIVQIVIDGHDPKHKDVAGSPLPTLVYVSREKRPGRHHNFKAGAMNALIRVSSVLSNSPIILNVDCDMYLNNSNALKDALCLFMDDRGEDVGYVQFPQYYENLTKNNLYGDSFNVSSKFIFPGMNALGGPCYIGTGCFHRRECISGERYGSRRLIKKDGGERSSAESVTLREESAKMLATCACEDGTQWGKEMGVKYGCIVEDIVTGISIQGKGWRSIYVNPDRKAFLGVAPITLCTLLVQLRRWSGGMSRMLVSAYNPVIYGYKKINIPLQMTYMNLLLWGPSSWAILCYVLLPSISLIKGIQLFPAVSSPWIVPFCYVFLAAKARSLCESLWSGETFKGWVNLQRAWMRNSVPCLLGVVDSILAALGFTNATFVVTTKVADAEVLGRYQQEVMEFGPPSFMFTMIALVCLLQLVGIVSGVLWFATMGVVFVERLLVQVALCGMLAFLSWPIYLAMFFRTDGGRMPTLVTVEALALALLASACIIWV